MSISKFITTKPAKRIRPVSFSIRDLERYIEQHEDILIVFRTSDPDAVIKNVGLYTGGSTNATVLKRLPRATTDHELHERIRLYTDLGYCCYPHGGVKSKEIDGQARVIYLLEHGNTSSFERPAWTARDIMTSAGRPPA